MDFEQVRDRTIKQRRSSILFLVRVKAMHRLSMKSIQCLSHFKFLGNFRSNSHINFSMLGDHGPHIVQDIAMTSSENCWTFLIEICMQNIDVYCIGGFVDFLLRIISRQEFVELHGETPITKICGFEPSSISANFVLQGFPSTLCPINIP